jgi:hypothetical protein
MRKSLQPSSKSTHQNSSTTSLTQRWSVILPKKIHLMPGLTGYTGIICLRLFEKINMVEMSGRGSVCTSHEEMNLCLAYA